MFMYKTRVSKTFFNFLNRCDPTSIVDSAAHSSGGGGLTMLQIFMYVCIDSLKASHAYIT